MAISWQSSTLFNDFSIAQQNSVEWAELEELQIAVARMHIYNHMPVSTNGMSALFEIMYAKGFTYRALRDALRDLQTSGYIWFDEDKRMWIYREELPI